MRSRVGKSECSESEAFVGTRGRRADGETFDSEREGGFRGRLQGGASGGKPQVSHNRPLTCPARRAQGIIIEGIKPSGKMLEAPPGCPRRRVFFSSPPGGRRGNYRRNRAKRKTQTLPPPLLPASGFPRFRPLFQNNSETPQQRQCAVHGKMRSAQLVFPGVQHKIPGPDHVDFLQIAAMETAAAEGRAG